MLCDLCNVAVGPSSKQFTPRDMRNAVRNGLRPDGPAIDAMMGVMSDLVGGTASFMHDAWAEQVMRDSTPWIACSKCTRRIESHLKKNSYGPATGRQKKGISQDDSAALIGSVMAGALQAIQEAVPDDHAVRRQLVDAAVGGVIKGILPQSQPQQAERFPTLAQLSVDERDSLNGVNPALCHGMILQKQGQPVAVMGFQSAVVDVLQKLTISELRAVEASAQLCVKAEGTDDQTATQLYREAFETNPFNDLAMMSYGCLLAASGNLREGIEWVRKASELNPLNDRAKRNLAAMEADLQSANVPSSVGVRETKAQAIEKRRERWQKLQHTLAPYHFVLTCYGIAAISLITLVTLIVVDSYHDDSKNLTRTVLSSVQNERPPSSRLLTQEK